MAVGRIGRAFAVLAGSVLLASGVGCGSDQSRFVTRERLAAGLVVSLDGIGGYNWGPRWLRSGLAAADVDAAIVIYDWSKGPGALFVGDLVAQERNQAAAQGLARLVTDYMATMPGRPVTLIGHSGGAAVVVWALEALGEDHSVDRAILLAPAIGPDYDLSEALRGVRRRMYVMYSHADVGLLGAGTAVFGTMDRQHSVSAGMVGFRLPEEPADRMQYLKVRQVPWTLGLVKTGHLGDHMGWTTTHFARDFLAPILTGVSDPGEPLVVVGSGNRPGAGAASPRPRAGGVTR